MTQDSQKASCCPGKNLDFKSWKVRKLPAFLEKLVFQKQNKAKQSTEHCP